MFLQKQKIKSRYIEPSGEGAGPGCPPPNSPGFEDVGGADDFMSKYEAAQIARQQKTGTGRLEPPRLGPKEKNGKGNYAISDYDLRTFFDYDQTKNHLAEGPRGPDDKSSEYFFVCALFET